MKTIEQYPEIIQGGMGIGVSHWCLAKAVSMQGQMGVVSGTAIDSVIVRRLQLGDPGGDITLVPCQSSFYARTDGCSLGHCY